MDFEELHNSKIPSLVVLIKPNNGKCTRFVIYIYYNVQFIIIGYMGSVTMHGC